LCSDCFQINNIFFLLELTETTIDLPGSFSTHYSVQTPTTAAGDVAGSSAFYVNITEYHDTTVTFTQSMVQAAVNTALGTSTGPSQVSGVELSSMTAGRRSLSTSSEGGGRVDATFMPRRNSRELRAASSAAPQNVRLYLYHHWY
jgi:hypothetical protein